MSREIAEIQEDAEKAVEGIHLDPSSAAPLHVQIRDALVSLMDSQALAPGARLPTVRRLAASCGVALRTAAQAVEMLQREGRVASRMGRGVFVRRNDETATKTQVYVCLHPSFMSVNAGARFRTLQGIIAKAQELGVELHPVTRGQELDLARPLPPGAGVIFMDSSYKEDGFGEIARLVLEQSLPCCVANNPLPPFVGVNAHHEDAICLSTEHVLRLGHRRVAFVNTPVGEPSRRPARSRQGYLTALKRYGVWPDPALYAEAHAPTDHSPEATEQILDRWLALPARPTAIVCDSDERALLMMERLRSKGLRVPQDISLTGHENMPASGQSDPPLTTVDARCPERGSKAIQYVMDRLSGKEPSPPEVFPELVVRQSTTAWKG